MSLSTETLQQFSDQLRMLRDDLHAEISQTNSANQPVELDQNRQGRLSRMDAMQGQAMAKASLVRLNAQFGEVKAAQERLRKGDFGRCLDCEQWISEPRLKLNPCARFCIDCATKRE